MGIADCAGAALAGSCVASVFVVELVVNTGTCAGAWGGGGVVAAAIAAGGTAVDGASAGADGSTDGSTRSWDDH